MAQFWNEKGFEPKRQFKFKVDFRNVTGDAFYLAQSADRPVYTISDTTKVDFLDKSFNFPGKITWTPVKIKFVEAVGNPDPRNVTANLYNYLTSAGWVSPEKHTGANASLSSINKNSSVTSTDQIKIEVLDSTGGKLDSWTLNNAWIASITSNNLDYSAEGVLTTELTIRYDWATYA